MSQSRHGNQVVTTMRCFCRDFSLAFPIRHSFFPSRVSCKLKINKNRWKCDHQSIVFLLLPSRRPYSSWAWSWSSVLRVSGSSGHRPTALTATMPYTSMGRLWWYTLRSFIRGARMPPSRHHMVLRPMPLCLPTQKQQAWSTVDFFWSCSCIWHENVIFGMISIITVDSNRFVLFEACANSDVYQKKIPITPKCNRYIMNKITDSWILNTLKKYI